MPCQSGLRAKATWQHRGPPSHILDKFHIFRAALARNPEEVIHRWTCLTCFSVVVFFCFLFPHQCLCLTKLPTKKECVVCSGPLWPSTCFDFCRHKGESSVSVWSRLQFGDWKGHITWVEEKKMRKGHFSQVYQLTNSPRADTHSEDPFPAESLLGTIFPLKSDPPT